MLVTVFGGSGFLGRHTVRALARAGHRVRVAVRRPHTAHFLLPMGGVDQIQLQRCDITDEGAVAVALQGAEGVVNLVGILAESGRQRFDRLHREAAERIARLAKAANARALVHVSALGADPAAPSHYSRSKAAGEAAVRDAFPDAVILRPSIIFGPEDHFFNRFANMARYLPFLPLIGGGRTRLQPVYVDDVAEAIRRALENSAHAGHTYELGGPKVATFAELMRYILTQTGRKRALVTLPFWLAALQGALLGLLPRPILTLDQVRTLKRDSIVSDTPDGRAVGTLADLGVMPTAIEAVVPTYLWRFRKTGQFAEPAPV